MHGGRLVDEVKGISIIDCTACGFKHMDPLPGDAMLDEIYKKEYYTKEKPTFIERSIEDEVWWNSNYDDRYVFLESALGEGRRELLDIGSGPGFFLKRALERGWSAKGVEPSVEAARFATSNGVTVINDFLDNAIEGGALQNGTFDAVHLSEVLEHIRDPAAVCEAASKLLRPGGLLCVVLPNDYNPLQEYLREERGFNPYWAAPPHHINYFDKKSITSLIKRSGFELLHTTATFPMEFFLLMGDDYVGNDELGRLCHKKRKNLEAALSTDRFKAFKDQWYALMASYGIGREFVIYARKKDIYDE